MKRIACLACVLLMLAVVSATARQPAARWAKFDGGKLRYYDVGPRKKDALVFVHGWTCDADFWKDSLNAFPESGSIALDPVGHGQSDKPKADYTMEYFARSVDAVLQAAGVNRAVLVGHS